MYDVHNATKLCSYTCMRTNHLTYKIGNPPLTLGKVSKHGNIEQRKQCTHVRFSLFLLCPRCCLCLFPLSLSIFVCISLLVGTRLQPIAPRCPPPAHTAPATPRVCCTLAPELGWPTWNYTLIWILFGHHPDTRGQCHNGNRNGLTPLTHTYTENKQETNNTHIRILTPRTPAGMMNDAIHTRKNDGKHRAQKTPQNAAPHTPYHKASPVCLSSCMFEKYAIC